MPQIMGVFGIAFDWGKTSANYVRFRDIYPQEFYDRIVRRNLCVEGTERS